MYNKEINVNVMNWTNWAQDGNYWKFLSIELPDLINHGASYI